MTRHTQGSGVFQIGTLRGIEGKADAPADEKAGRDERGHFAPGAPAGKGFPRQSGAPAGWLRDGDALLGFGSLAPA